MKIKDTRTLKLILVFGIVALLSSCALFQSAPQPLPPVQVVTRPVQIDVYQPPLPPAIKLDEVTWFVLTEENLDEKIQEIKDFSGDFVVFAVTPSTYENITYNLQEIKRYVSQQKEIILYYRNATQAPAQDTWLDKNEAYQQMQLDAVDAEEPEVEIDNRNWFQKVFRLGK